MKKIAFFLAFVAVSAVSLHAQAVPNVDTVIAKYVKTIGGADKWKAIESIKQTGFVVVQGMNIPFTAIQARPNLSYSEGEFQGNKFIDAYDGTVAWTQNPFAGAAKPTKKDEDATKEAAKEQFEDELIDCKAKGHTVEIAPATEDKEGTKCFKITMKRKQGDEKVFYIDAENYVTVSVTSYVASGEMKGKAVETVMSDYKSVDGVMVPHTIEQKMDGQTGMTIKADKVELNSKIDKAIFSLPK